MIDEEKIKDLFEEKYEDRLGLSYRDWLEHSPQTEEEAYARLEVINDELDQTEEKYQEALGDEKWELGDYRERLRNEYALIEEMFGLESHDE